MTEEKIKIEMTLDELADIQHQIWASWMKWLFDCCTNDFGICVLSLGKQQRWKRQMNTDYKDLSDEEKESDRKVVKEFLLKNEQTN